MIKFASLAAVAAASAAFSVPAFAAVLEPTPSVHVSLVGKTSDQVQQEIRDAAVRVCASYDQSCVNEATETAFQRLRAIERARTGGVAVTSGPMVVHISLQGKSPAAIDVEIRQAANAVCRAASAGVPDLSACVTDAVSDAHAQLRSIAKANAVTEVASS
jgi:hypothetical protein